MTVVAKHSKSIAFCVAAATASLLWALPAEAGRVITASASGGPPGTGVAAGLFSCGKSNLFAPALDTGPFDCIGAVAHPYSQAADFGIIEGMVNSRIPAWTSSNESGRVTFNSNYLFFNAATQGDFVLVFSGSWLNPLSNNQRTGWSSYYLLEDIEILGPLSTQNSLRYNFNWKENNILYTTSDLMVDAVSFYRINRTAVPEPSALALVGLALAGLVLASRRGRRATAPTAAAGVSPD